MKVFIAGFNIPVAYLLLVNSSPTIPATALNKSLFKIYFNYEYALFGVLVTETFAQGSKTIVGTYSYEL